jgi:hypothetical protein
MLLGHFWASATAPSEAPPGPSMSNLRTAMEPDSVEEYVRQTSLGKDIKQMGGAFGWTGWTSWTDWTSWQRAGQQAGQYDGQYAGQCAGQGGQTKIKQNKKSTLS